MKKLGTFTILISFILFAVPVWSQTTPTEVITQPENTIAPTSANTPVPTENLDSEVDKLKEKVAEKVSELSENSDEVTAGVITKIADNSFSLNTDNSEVEVTTDNTLTSYYEVQSTSFLEVKRDNFIKGDYIFVIGPEINGVITANAVYKDQKFMVLTGKITKVNQTDFSIDILSLDKTTYTLDIQTTTNQRLLNIKTLALEAIGFSKLKEGDSIHVVVKSNLKNPKSTRYDASRLLIVPNEYFIQ